MGEGLKRAREAARATQKGNKQMTKEEATELGIASQRAKDMFFMLSQENTKTNPEEREKQVARYEAARSNMHEAMNRHHAALKQLGLLPS